MNENSLRTAILAGAAAVFLALPSLAWAGQVVPPGNSAATQYTQVFPTSGGNVAVGTSIGETAGGGKRKPSQVIGEKTTQQLESHGSEGAAVAQLAAESAPEPAGEAEASEGSSAAAAGDRNSGGGSSSGHQGTAGSANGDRNGSNGKGDSAPAGKGAQGSPRGAEQTALEASGSGSSGFSEVLGQATGASSGQMGFFLPLVLVAALVLALAYAWRRRHHEPETTP